MPRPSSKSGTTCELRDLLPSGLVSVFHPIPVVPARQCQAQKLTVHGLFAGAAERLISGWDADQGLSDTVILFTLSGTGSVKFT